jgi:hypothetical protein
MATSRSPDIERAFGRFGVKMQRAGKDGEAVLAIVIDVC